ncbi:Uncharacterised protein [Candidatus Burarchaeum australiense]|nr:Uncharacterised protein [Candidatus Burarchaeum australiense]
MMQKKAQAAIEFLTTYGWAILVVALVLLALNWMNFFNPGRVIQNYCAFPINTFGCDNIKLTSTTLLGMYPLSVTVDLTNNLGRKIYLCSLYCDPRPADPTTGVPPGYGPTPTCYDPASIPAYLTYEPGEKKPQGIICANELGELKPLPVGTKYTAKIYVFYSYDGEVGTQKARLFVGDLMATAEPG